MRIFVAVKPSAEAVKHLSARLAAQPVPPGLRIADPGSWHVTLAFAGELSEAAVARLDPRLERATGRHPAMTLRLRGSGAFSSPARARSWWVGLDGDLEVLRRLAWAVGAACRRVGAEIEERRFRAHLSLGRASSPRDLRSLVTSWSDYEGPTWVCEEVELVRSRLGAGPRGGPAYDVLGRYRLRGDARG